MPNKHRANIITIIFLLLISSGSYTAQAKHNNAKTQPDSIPLASGLWQGQGSCNGQSYPTQLEIQQDDTLFTATLKSPVASGMAIHYIKGEYSPTDKQFNCADIGTDRDKPAGDPPPPISHYEFRLVEDGTKLVGSAQIDPTSKMLFLFSKASDTNPPMDGPKTINSSSSRRVLIMAPPESLRANQAAAFIYESKSDREAGNLDESRKLLEQACLLDPNLNSSTVHTELGQTLQQLDELNLALNEYQTALSFKPDMASAMFNVAACYSQLGYLNESIALLQDFLNKYPDGERAEAAKRMLISIQKSPKLQDNPNSPDYYINALASQAARWAADKQPIKVFIESGKKVEGYDPSFDDQLTNAFDQWCAVTNNRLAWTLTNKKKKANIVCHWISDRSELKNANGAELGQTLLKYYPDPANLGKYLILNAEMALSTTNFDKKKVLTKDQIQSLCLHEVGHALGIKTHSSNNNDVMFFMIKSHVTTQLSPRDKATLIRLYSY